MSQFKGGGEFSIPNFEGLGGLAGWDFRQSKAHDFPIPVNAEFCSVCRCCSAILMASYGPSIRPSFGEVRINPGGRKWDQSKCRPHIPIRLLQTQRYRPILHRLVTIHNAADRQSDRNMPPMLQHRRPKMTEMGDKGRDWTYLAPSVGTKRSIVVSA